MLKSSMKWHLGEGKTILTTVFDAIFHQHIFVKYLISKR